MILRVDRLWQAPATEEYKATTTGMLSVEGVQKCFTLENTELIIPAGTYELKLQKSKRFDRDTPWLQNVPGRSDIEIHGANHATDVIGCIGVAEKRINDYTIQDTPPSTSWIESQLAISEAAGESSTIEIIGPQEPTL